MNGKYHFFWKSKLSQWTRSKFKHNGHTFVTAEQAMMWSKAELFGDSEIAKKILKTGSPKEQKALGRQVKNFNQDVWDEHKYDIVFNINVDRFLQCEKDRIALLATGNKEIVEASPYDKVWGIGMTAEEASRTPKEDWKGENLLGQVLTEVREAIRD